MACHLEHWNTNCTVLYRHGAAAAILARTRIILLTAGQTAGAHEKGYHAEQVLQCDGLRQSREIRRRKHGGNSTHASICSGDLAETQREREKGGVSLSAEESAKSTSFAESMW